MRAVLGIGHRSAWQWLAPFHCRRLSVPARCVNRKDLRHTPVLLKEVLGYFKERDLKVLLDCTLGGGGHTAALIQQHPELEHVIGVDVDEVAIEHARRKLHPVLGQKSVKAHILNGNFRDLPKLLASHQPPLGHFLNEGIDGILMDLGMSSLQVDDAERGFSIMNDGPLDMRMDLKNPVDAAQIVNTWSEFELAEMIRNYGQDGRWKQVARKICKEREKSVIETTRQLAKLIHRKPPSRKTVKQNTHAATRVFQAIRIAVNDELKNLVETLPIVISSLRSGGRLCVMSFHSLEDRIVKRAFLEAAGKSNTFEQASDYDLRNRWNAVDDQTMTCLGTIITKRPVRPTKEEKQTNPRSRSAKLRVFQKT